MSKKQASIKLLWLGALGVVFGDIGTSPLYALMALFGSSGRRMQVDEMNILGVISLIIWSVIIVVSIKYIGFVMKVNNNGEGGIMALVSLVKKVRMTKRTKLTFILLGVMGMSLFYGDGIITPAISVLSAVEGLKMVTPSLDVYVVPAAIAILVLLFGLQRFGTSIIGKLFGPVMLVWFFVIAVAGLAQIWQHPYILSALFPFYAINFFATRPDIAFVSMTAVILAITGAEALYVDMGHFGRKPLARAWFVVVLPALLLCYMGQGAVLLSNPSAIANPFYYLFPSTLFIPVVALATFATMIASQSVISGAFSLTRQAVQLGFLPKMLVKHTSDEEKGQVYIPFVNVLLFIAVVAVVLTFRSSVNLAGAYGVAISLTLVIDTILLMAIVWYKTRRSYKVILYALFVFLPLEILFVTANISKIFSGGWLPLAVGISIFYIATTWMRGQYIVAEERQRLEGTLPEVIAKLKRRKQLFVTSGTAVYIGHYPGYAPKALHTAIDSLNEVYRRNIILSVKVINQPHVESSRRLTCRQLLKSKTTELHYVELTYGYHDTPNVPRSLEMLEDRSVIKVDPKTLQYFVSLTKVVPTKRRIMASWRKALYIFMERNQRSLSDHLKLPTDRTIDIETLVRL